MFKDVIIVASALFLMSAAPSFAAQQTEGVVVSVNPATGELALQSGEMFRFADASNLLGVLPGDFVGVSHTDGMGHDIYNPHPSTR